MNFRELTFAIVVSLLLISPAAAQTVEGRVISQLQALGYTRIDVSRTLLGRSRIRAENDDSRREIVVDPRNGVILRDYVYLRKDGKDDGFLSRLLGGGESSNSGSGSSNSGPGSENSGSGSSNSGSGSSNSGSGSSNSGSGSSNSGSGSDDDDHDEPDDDD